MWISRFKVESFASFQETDWIALDPKFNLFVGQNNSGKSALLRALVPPLVSNPHKNPQAFRGNVLKPSQVYFDLNITVSEIFDRLSALGIDPIFPAGDGQDPKMRDLKVLLDNPNNNLTLELARNATTVYFARNGASLPNFRGSPNTIMTRAIRADNSVELNGMWGTGENIGAVSSVEAGTVFHFAAQRLNVGRSGLDSPNKLSSNASNLPAVLAHLQGARRPIFDVIEAHAIDIIGGFERVTVAPRGHEFHILIWPSRDAIYEELAFELNESGTGIGQILAILTAVVTSENSVIIIDEINSFLHPAAVKKLLALLRSDYPQHQYIISTHSADTISSCSAERIYMIERQGYSSSIKGINLEVAHHAREVAGKLGFSMMDVFGFDRMIWVEGPTEEVCFPYLVRHFELGSLHGIGFSSVGSPAELTVAAKAQSVMDAYDRAGKQLSPLLRGMAFALDREGLSDNEVAAQERSKRKLRFLPRRCFESYLICPAAIAKVISDLDNRTISPDDVSLALNVGGENRFCAPSAWNGDIANPDWLKRVDGAKLLKHLFSSLTDNRVEFRKTRDAIELTRYIAKFYPEALGEVTAYLTKILDVARKDTLA